MQSIELRSLTSDDAKDVLKLYKAASASGTLGRDADEYELSTISEMIATTLEQGFCIGAFNSDSMCGEIHAARLRARRFTHVFAGLSIAVDPHHQGRGIGRMLFVELLRRIDRSDPKVLRTELMLEAGNPGALKLYQDLGFIEEGRLVGRVMKADGRLVDDIMMARTRR